MSNKEEFDRYVIAILAKLYENFPQAAMISVQDFDVNPDRNTVENFAGTVEFLTNENYIRHGGGDDEGYFVSGATLTMKGLKALNRVPEFFEDKTTWGQRFVGIVKGGAKEAGKETVKALVTQFVAGQ